MSDRYTFEAWSTFAVTRNVSSVPANAPRGCLFFARQVEFLIEEGDTIEILPGGFFVTRSGEFERKPITHSQQILDTIREHSELVRVW